MPSVAGCRCPRVQPPSHVPACREGCRTLGALRGPPCPLAVMHSMTPRPRRSVDRLNPDRFEAQASCRQPRGPARG
jgi:hypothetical protein